MFDLRGLVRTTTPDVSRVAQLTEPAASVPWAASYTPLPEDAATGNQIRIAADSRLSHWK